MAALQWFSTLFPLFGKKLELTLGFVLIAVVTSGDFMAQR
ncbi:Hypothetical protein I595_788 [Croceitalea dokdonensis DOKDO 023]|uniref:Uncharacterized protein n=1 Tax=Croceitalea dokdonensis DOKDO 023 TaxID=1300341 RepID=A0A0P7AWJ0_9FLAO|nr:Hypothetical protein I595_788 [Croceitalea dokdonensis DOKDO 023]